MIAMMLINEAYKCCFLTVDGVNISFINDDVDRVMEESYDSTRTLWLHVEQ
jgi:hypothetical protein